MKSLKDRILSHTFAIAKDKRPELTPYVDMRQSVFITGVDKATYPEINVNEVDFSKLMFNDFVAVMECRHDPKSTVTHDAGILIRVFKKNDVYVSGTFMMLITEGNIKNSYAVLCGIELDCVKQEIQLVHIPEVNTKFVTENDKSIVEEFLKVIYVTQNYERMVKKGVPRKYAYQKLPWNVRDTHIEYTIDLTKPKYVQAEVSQDKRKHAGMPEHERRGHWRTYKSGKKVFIKSCEINKGKGNKVEKSYKL